MPMHPCNKCLENSWTFKKEDDGTITATCICGNEVNFERKKPEALFDGAKCRKCNGRIILKESKFKPSKLLKPYYYTASYYCPKCHTRYMSEKFKVYNK